MHLQENCQKIQRQLIAYKALSKSLGRLLAIDSGSINVAGSINSLSDYRPEAICLSHHCDRAIGAGGYMFDFHDRLTHPFASVAMGEFKSGRFEEAQQLYEKAVSTYREGFQGAYLLREPDSDRGISVIFWETQEAMDASKGEIHDAILRQMSPLFAAKPLLENYEIACSVQQSGAADSGH